MVQEVQKVTEDSNLYERVRNGFQVLLFGPPNSGKSSLLNFLGNYKLISKQMINNILAKKKISIVNEQEGTTRDLVHYDAQLNGVPVRLTDSAGIRKSSCKIETIGMELAKKT